MARRDGFRLPGTPGILLKMARVPEGPSLSRQHLEPIKSRRAIVACAKGEEDEGSRSGQSMCVGSAFAGSVQKMAKDEQRKERRKGEGEGSGQSCHEQRRKQRQDGRLGQGTTERVRVTGSSDRLFEIGEVDSGRELGENEEIRSKLEGIGRRSSVLCGGRYALYRAVSPFAGAEGCSQGSSCAQGQ
ncbi:hypothetical protein CRG98_007696 [Punica granatum]|uniref:Uncharacterized protein n=1 Tax=Punica granatum TaxID=22663 RepID=A0A2I0KTX9_PUNGR|nr:hypothetical protein CRG98_007696 [Punica granatum]